MIRGISSLVLLALSKVALGGHSPNADLVDEFVSLSNSTYSSSAIEDAKLDVPSLIAKHGYPVESHDVITEDGYNLTLHRIPHGRDNRPDIARTVVFLMHGLASSSAQFVTLGPGNALGYLLAEEGYDVWIGNARGNYYSRRHIRLNPDSRFNKNFWRFSWDEIGYYDLPAFLDHIQNVTGQSKLHYIGHSQGGTAFLVLNSLRPEYNERFISFQGLAPATYFTNNVDPTIKAAAPLENIMEFIVFSAGTGEVYSNRKFISWFRKYFCFKGTIFTSMCGSNSFLSSVMLNETMAVVFQGHFPAGASIRQFTHYLQNARFNTFSRFNHNPLKNLALYGTRTPPSYNMTSVTVPSYLYFSTNDALVAEKDVKFLASKLPNLKVLHLVDTPGFGHVDFLWGASVKQLLYDKMLLMLRQAENDV